MIVYRICKLYPPDYNPIDGKGAAMYPGRWNTKGLRMVYTSSSLALARSEMARRIDLSLVPDGYYVYELEIPEHLIRDIKLPENWNNDPPDLASKKIGEEYFQKGLLGIKVPSICDPQSFNFLLNPSAKDFEKVLTLRYYPFTP